MDELSAINQILITNQQVAAALAQMLAQKQAQATEQQWVSLEDGAAALGPAFSTAKLRDDINNGWLKHGIHFIDTSNGKRPNYRSALPPCESCMRLPQSSGSLARVLPAVSL